MKLRHIALALAAPFLFFAVGCSEEPASKASPTTMTEQHAIATRPLCVGRFLIDVPAETRVTWTDTRTALTGVIKREGELSENAFATRMRREQERVGGHASEDASLLKEVREVEDGQGRILVFRDDPSNDLYFDMKAFSLLQGTLFSLFGQAEDARLSQAIGDLQKGMSMLKPRDTWTIPTEPGFCFDGGFLPGGDGGFEATGVQLTFKAYPGLMIALETQTNEQGAFAGPDLIARTEQGQGILDPGQRATMVRKDARKSVNGRAGQEVMMKRQVDGALRLVGYLQIDAEPGRTDAPSIAFSLGLTPSDDVAERIPADADAEVIELWDEITQSLRLRPGAV